MQGSPTQLAQQPYCIQGLQQWRAKPQLCSLSCRRQLHGTRLYFALTCSAASVCHVTLTPVTWMTHVTLVPGCRPRTCRQRPLRWTCASKHGRPSRRAQATPPPPPPGAGAALPSPQQIRRMRPSRPLLQRSMHVSRPAALCTLRSHGAARGRAAHGWRYTSTCAFCGALGRPLRTRAAPMARVRSGTRGRRRTCSSCMPCSRWTLRTPGCR